MEYPHVMQYEYKNHTIDIVYDESSESPRDWDQLGTIVTTNGRYLSIQEGKLSIDEIEDLNRDDYVILPIYAYIHGNICIRTSPFSCPFDSGQIGYIYCKSGAEGLTYKEIENYLTGEIKELNKYLNGEVYGFNISSDKTPLTDSCYGYYDIDHCKSDAESIIDHYINNNPQQLELL